MQYLVSWCLERNLPEARLEQAILGGRYVIDNKKIGNIPRCI